MVSENGEYDAARRAAETVFREKVGRLVRAVLLAVTATFGLLVTASSFNLSFFLMIPGILVGVGIVFASVRGILRISGLLG